MHFHEEPRDPGRSPGGSVNEEGRKGGSVSSPLIIEDVYFRIVSLMARLEDRETLLVLLSGGEGTSTTRSRQKMRVEGRVRVGERKNFEGLVEILQKREKCNSHSRLLSQPRAQEEPSLVTRGAHTQWKERLVTNLRTV